VWASRGSAARATDQRYRDPYDSTRLFKNTFERWADDPRGRDFAVHIRAAVSELQGATAAMGPPRSSSRRTAAARRTVPKSLRQSTVNESAVAAPAGKR
jgi:hypothetical protein